MPCADGWREVAGRRKERGNNRKSGSAGQRVRRQRLTSQRYQTTRLTARQINERGQRVPGESEMPVLGAIPAGQQTEQMGEGAKGQRD